MTQHTRFHTPLVWLRRRQRLPRWVRRADSKVGRAINRWNAHPATDAAFLALSRSADRGRLWFSIAAVLYAARQRRAALRGVLSLTVASIVANLIGKKLFGGDRPLLKDIPVGRRLKKPPTSGSFPSGHSASAGAFAVGVALESPVSGAALAPLAWSVAYSRLHVGAHWFSDVIGGYLLGAGVAALGKLVVPARRKALALPEVLRVPLPASPDGDGLLIFVNDSSGPAGEDPFGLLARRLPRAELRRLGDGDAIEITRAAMESPTPPRVLGICGGDGSVCLAAHLARTHSVPLLVLPGGTFNHFARTAGVGTFDAAFDALERGEGVLADVGELTIDDGEPTTVINAASVGLYPEFIDVRERYQDRLGKWAAGVLAAVRVLRHADPVDVELEGRRERVWSVFVGINRNRPLTVAPMQRDRLDDGMLDVRILRAHSRLHAIASLAFGRRTGAVLRALGLMPTSNEVVELQQRDVTLHVHRTPEGLPGLAHDGEVAEVDESSASYTARVRNLPAALKVYSPH